MTEKFFIWVLLTKWTFSVEKKNSNRNSAYFKGWKKNFTQSSFGLNSNGIFHGGIKLWLGKPNQSFLKKLLIVCWSIITDLNEHCCYVGYLI